jgi:hypothetical protein
MNEFTTVTINTLPKICWVSPEKDKHQQHEKELRSADNLLALIVSCMTDNFPELERCKETRFISFQEELKNILLQHERRSALDWSSK